MRPKNTQASLGEIMGGADKQSMSLSNLPQILGEKMQEMPRTAVGRFRFIKALQQRFGDGFRNISGIKGMIKEFDDDIAFEGVIANMKKIKAPKKKES